MLIITVKSNYQSKSVMIFNVTVQCHISTSITELHYDGSKVPETIIRDGIFFILFKFSIQTNSGAIVSENLFGGKGQ